MDAQAIDVVGLVKRTDEMFSVGLPVPDGLPKPPETMRRLIEEYEEASLAAQARLAIHEVRKWQAARLGFQLVSESHWDQEKSCPGMPDLSAMLSDLTGAAPTRSYRDDENRNAKIEWCYNHHVDSDSRDSRERGDGAGEWKGCVTRTPAIYERWEKNGPWYLPPFSKKLAYRWMLFNVDALVAPVPYGIMLKMAEARKTKLFNSFIALAPRAAFSAPKTIDPVIMAVQWEFRRTDDGWYTGNHACWFLGRWE
jgi:hypothetical protein